MEKEHKKALKELIEDTGYGLMQDISIAQGAIDDLCEGMADLTGITKSTIKKMMTVHFKACQEDDRAKFLAFDKLYTEVVE